MSTKEKRSNDDDGETRDGENESQEESVEGRKKKKKMLTLIFQQLTFYSDMPDFNNKVFAEDEEEVLLAGWIFRPMPMPPPQMPLLYT